MTAIVILNVIGAILIVTAIVSLLAWAVLRERRHPSALLPASTRPSAGPRRQPRAARAVLDLR